MDIKDKPKTIENSKHDNLYQNISNFNPQNPSLVSIPSERTNGPQTLNSDRYGDKNNSIAGLGIYNFDKLIALSRNSFNDLLIKNDKPQVPLAIRKQEASEESFIAKKLDSNLLIKRHQTLKIELPENDKDEST